MTYFENQKPISALNMRDTCRRNGILTPHWEQSEGDWIFCKSEHWRWVCMSVFDILTCSSPAWRVPPGPTNKMRHSRQLWSKKSSKALWFSSNPIKRFHLSVLSRRMVKACSLRKSTRSSEMALVFTCSIETRTPASAMLRNWKKE